MSKASDIGIFKGMKFSGNVKYNILQFADDTVWMGECSWKNLRSFKAIFRGFKLASGLKVNFLKSKIYGLNSNDHFFEVTSYFLSYCTDKIPFKFLGIVVRTSPMRASSWIVIINNLERKLLVWNAKFLSIGGRITLLNSTLNNIPIYMLSIYKAPKIVLKEIIIIQSKFLWLGGNEKKGVNWVSWENVFKSKEDEGLRMNDISLVNVALLSKWRWIFLHEPKAIWMGVLGFRYGNLLREALNHDSTRALKIASI